MLPNSNIRVIFLCKVAHPSAKLFRPSDVRLRASIDFTFLKTLKDGFESLALDFF